MDLSSDLSSNEDDSFYDDDWDDHKIMGGDQMTFDTGTPNEIQREFLTSEPSNQAEDTSMESYTLKLRQQAISDVLESDSVDESMSQSYKDREAIYKAKLLSPGWMYMLFDHELDYYPLEPGTYSLWGYEMDFVLENATLISEARKVFWGMNAFDVGGFFVGELLALRGARDSIVKVRVTIDADADREDWKYEYKSLIRLLQKCPKLDWVIIKVRGQDSSRELDLVEQRTGHVLEVLEQVRQQRQWEGKGKGSRPKRGVFLSKWTGNNTYEVVYGYDRIESGLAKEEHRRDRVNSKIRKQQIKEGRIPC